MNENSTVNRVVKAIDRELGSTFPKVWWDLRDARWGERLGDEITHGYWHAAGILAFASRHSREAGWLEPLIELERKHMPGRVFWVPLETEFQDLGLHALVKLPASLLRVFWTWVP